MTTRVCTASRSRGLTAAAGIAAVELALLLPVLTLSLIGAMDFGRVFYDAIKLTGAAGAGVRYGAQSTEHSEDTAGMEQKALDELAGVSDVTVTAERFCECSDGTPVACTDSCGALDPSLIFVRVRAQKTFETLFTYPGIPSTVNLDREAVARVR